MQSSKIVLNLAYMFVNLIEFIDNTTVIVIVYRCKGLRTVANLLFVSLATLDFLSCLIGFGTLLFRLGMIKYFTRRKSDVLCRVLTNGTVGSVSVQISKITLCCVAIERYLSACYPLKKYCINKTYLWCIIMTIWLAGGFSYTHFVYYTDYSPQYYNAIPFETCFNRNLLHDQIHTILCPTSTHLSILLYQYYSLRTEP